jgi:hypothetical protein
MRATVGRQRRAQPAFFYSFTKTLCGEPKLTHGTPLRERELRLRT